MHYLHKILVHIPRDMLELGFTREELISMAEMSGETVIMEYDSDILERGYEIGPGRWEDDYPQKAYLASDDLEWFLKELEEVLAFQKEHIDRYLRNLTDAFGTDLTVIVEKLWKKSGDYREKDGVDADLRASDFSLLAQLLHGDYFCESHFYNEKRRTSRLYPSDIELIKQNPEEWALVMFDIFE